MEIFDYFSNEQRSWIDKIRVCEWSAAKFLADLLEQNTFHKSLGNGSLFIMADGEKLVSFCTLTHRDCIKDDNLFPWIGFVFTAPDYREKRYSSEVIEAACSRASRQGFDKVYLATDHVGLYEKYGFIYMESRTDIYGEESRIYCRQLME
ncbi:MAG: GNAT family N-acetyltransferase [Oscillospiraceae bacterium]|nr:GNAT family N-acetyltransferase [Oscillospiraceae bacterium]